ncbi:MAG: diheme cytochrome c [Zetaproteobacteria bacterium]|nr:diheme cytochrome c [Zetaproteobacteria bacterium]
MKKHYALIVPLVCSTLLCTPAFADDDGHHEGEEGIFNIFSSRGGVQAFDNALYTSNCAECHFAYQPGLLPARSWKRLMDPKALADHFGENAELDEADRAEIEQMLVDNAADQSHYNRSIKIMRSLSANEAPLRITETPYFKRKHNEIPARAVKENKDVRSFSYCNKCHTQAARGSFDEHEVKIPNFGRWED